MYWRESWLQYFRGLWSDLFVCFEITGIVNPSRKNSSCCVSRNEQKNVCIPFTQIIPFLVRNPLAHYYLPWPSNTLFHFFSWPSHSEKLLIYQSKVYNYKKRNSIFFQASHTWISKKKKIWCVCFSCRCSVYSIFEVVKNFSYYYVTYMRGLWSTLISQTSFSFCNEDRH